VSVCGDMCEGTTCLALALSPGSISLSISLSLSLSLSLPLSYFVKTQMRRGPAGRAGLRPPPPSPLSSLSSSSPHPPLPPFVRTRQTRMRREPAGSGAPGLTRSDADWCGVHARARGWVRVWERSAGVGEKCGRGRPRGWHLTIPRG
jgi:hypothetical protein